MQLAEKSGQVELVAELVKSGGKLRPVSASGGRFRQAKGS